MKRNVSFEEWITEFAPSLANDSYSFKGDLLGCMKRAYEIDESPDAAIDAARSFTMVHERLLARLKEKRG